MNENGKKERLDSLMRLARRRRVDAVMLFGQKNIWSMTGFDCDKGVLVIDGERVRYATDFS